MKMPCFSDKISCHMSVGVCFRAKFPLESVNEKGYTPNANMADHSVGARDESHESEVSQALMFCFDNAFPEKSCFVVDLVTLFRPLYPFLCS